MWSIPGGGFFGPVNASINLPTSNFNPLKPTESYNSAYNAARGTNQQMYDKIQAGYAQMLAQSQQANAELDRRYGVLQKGVVNQLRGSNQSNIQDINDKYSAMSGQMSQSMIDRGLGNTTVQYAMQRGVAADQVKETTRSQNAFAQLMADTRSRLGGARLSALERGYGNLMGIQGKTLDWMNSVSMPYPDPGMYAQLAMAQGSNVNPFGLGGSGLPGMPGPKLGPTADWYAQQGRMMSGGGGGDSGYTPGPITIDLVGFGPQQQGGYSLGYMDGPSSGYGLTKDGGYYPSYATSTQDSWAPSAGGDYYRAEATY